MVYIHLGFDYSLNYLTGPQVCFVELFLWSTRCAPSLSCSADCLSGQISGIQMFFCRAWIPALPGLSQTLGAKVRPSACLSERHAPPPGHSHELSFQVVQHGLSNWPKSNAHWWKNVPHAALDELCSSTLVLILPPARCNAQDVAPWLSDRQSDRTGSS